MKTIFSALGLWAFLTLFAIAYALFNLAEFLTRNRWPRRSRRDLADTFDPIRPIRRGARNV
jgi:hypothetical protein